MKISSCSCCQKNNPIVYSDYCYPDVSIKLCWACLEKLGWETEMRTLFPIVKKCNECKQFYLSRKATSAKCYVCWDSFFNSKTKLEVKEDENRELQQLQIM